MPAGPIAESQVVAPHVRQIALLVRAAGADQAARHARDVVARPAPTRRRPRTGVAAAGSSCSRSARCTSGRSTCPPPPVRSNRSRSTRAAPAEARALHAELVAAPPHLDAEPLLDQPQVLVERPAQRREARVVLGQQLEFRRRLRRRPIRAAASSAAVPRPRAGLAAHEPSAQRVVQRLGDLDVDEAVDQRGVAVEIDPAVVLGAAGELRARRAC